MARKRRNKSGGSDLSEPAYKRQIFKTREDFKNGVRAALPDAHDYNVRDPVRLYRYDEL
jgi:hypothetical protein